MVHKLMMGGLQLMRIFYSVKTKLHDPLYEINNGEKIPHPENPKRVEIILNELLKEGFKIIEETNSKIPFRLLTQVHNKDFVQFVRHLSNLLKKDERIYPDVFLREKMGNWKSNLALMGQYSFDVYTPIMNGTYQAAISAASLSFKGASEVANGKEKKVYALCHPIGHHALSNKMGGYSYFNNAAIAGEYLSGFGKVAILDLDFHHGNGTQEIFYQRDDVLFVSIHADPNVKFPYYWGYKQEKGKGKGLGYTINYPLALGTDNNAYQTVLEKAVRNIDIFKPKFLVISLGFDTYKDDPIGGFRLTTDYYRKMGQTIGRLNIPTVIIQEGGYDLNALGKNVVSFLKGIS